MKLALVSLALFLAGCHKPEGDPCSSVAALAEDRRVLIERFEREVKALNVDKQALEQRIAELEAAQPKPEARKSVGRLFEEYAARADRYVSR